MTENIHKYIGNQFGKDCLNSGYKAEKIIAKAQKDLLNERVRQTNFTINVLKNKVSEISDNLRGRLPGDVHDRVSQFTAQSQLTQHQKSKERQQNKYARLQNSAPSARRSRSDLDKNWRNNDGLHPDSDLKDRWVKNLSSRPLSVVERDVLAKGLNYSVAPDRIPHVELITATESAIKHNNLDTSTADELRTKISSCLVNAKVPNSNLNKEQQEAVNSLGKDKDIFILPADKGRCTVVLDKVDYDKKVSELLSDSKTYELLKRDPTSGYKKKVIDCLQQLEKSEVIDRPLYYKLYPGESVPKFYGLPKIHKQHAPLRPIVSSIDSVTYNVAKHLAYIIGPLVGKSQHHIVNSKDFVDKIKDIQLEEGETITSYDVSALFTCVPPDEAVDVVKEFLINDNTKAKEQSLILIKKDTHTDQYLLFDSHHPLVHKLGVIKTLFHRADTISSNEDAKTKEHKHLKSALGACGYRKWTFEKALHKPKSPTKDDASHTATAGEEKRRHNVTIPYVSELSEKIRRIFRGYQIPVSFKPTNTLRQKLVHPKDKVPKDKQNNLVYAIPCTDNGCKDLYIGETKQPLAKRMYQHRRASSGCGDSAVYSHLNSTNHTFDNKDVVILDRESRWFERGVKEAVYVKREEPSLNRGGASLGNSDITSAEDSEHGEDHQKMYLQ
ncbi:uncharacterized protein [Amphiura filiformis]|uniref:uncharacterized protein n=1 Tax=Amphiura filiformis TaxID=82378 RepID=UPI003B221125